MDIISLEAHWQVVAGAIGLIVWLVRLEGKTLNTEKRLDHAEQQLDNLESGLVKELAEVKQSLARIEGYLKAKAEEYND
jgi:hypothetical protein